MVILAKEGRHIAIKAMRLMLIIWIQANKDEELLEGTTIEQYVQMDGQSMRTYTDRMRQLGE